MKHKHIWFQKYNLIQYNALHFGSSLLPNPVLIKQQIAKDLHDSQIDLSAITGKKLVVNFIGEGHCPQVIEPFLNGLKILPVADLLIMFSTCTEIKHLPYQAVFLKTCMVNHCQWFDRIKTIAPLYQVDHKFICLMRRPSISRARLASKLLHNIDSLKLSFGCMNESTVLSEYQAMLPDHDLPILIDGIVDRKLESEYNEHDQSNPIFHNCLFNIVVESSSQTDDGIWRSQFVTEKTFKAFGLRQIPLWMAVPGLVSHVRFMGFDLFDDIIDHSYDTILDENSRRDQLVEQITQLDLRYTLNQCQQLRNQLSLRLENNFQLLNSLSKSSKLELDLVLKQFGEQTYQ
jgi:hypothetical protein